MNKISKLLATFALCGLFTISNTSGIEEKMPPAKLSSMSAIASNRFEKGIWYKFIPGESPILTDTITFNGNIGVYDFLNDVYDPCSSISFYSTYFRYYRVVGDPISLNYSTMNSFDLGFALCFGVSTPIPSALSSFFYEDNSTLYPFVHLTYNIDLIATEFQPLIYLGYKIYDNFYVQYGSDSQPWFTEEVSFFAGHFISGGSHFVGMKARYIRWNGTEYTIDGLTPKEVPTDTDGFGLYACTNVFYVRPDETELEVLSMGSYFINGSRYSSNLVFNEKKYSSIQILSYSTETNIIPNNRALNSFEALLMRPENVDFGFTDNGNVFTNAFSLIALVYTSLAGFLSFQIFPGLTLGLFLLIPLVVTIIVLIFKVVK